MSSVAPPPVTLAPGEIADLDEVMTIMAKAFSVEFGEAWTRSQCAGIMPMHGVVLTVARDARTGAIRGFTLARTVMDEAELLLIGVDPSSQREGVGRALLDHFVTRAMGASATRLHLEVRDGNPAIVLYRACTFEIVGRRRNYYRGLDGRQFDALTLVRQSN